MISATKMSLGLIPVKKAYSANFVYGNVYQASVDFLRTLAPDL